MISMTKSITIPAPPESIFDILNDTPNLPQIWRNIRHIRNVKTLPNGGQSFDFDYHMAGITLQGSSTPLVFERPTRIVSRTTGGIISTLTWNLTQQPAGTLVAFLAEYEVPVPLVGKLAEALIAKANETDIVYVMNYLKLKCR